MKVLLIGASGQTGRHILKMLLAQGHEVTALARSSSKLTETNPSHLRVVQGDALDLQSMERAVEGQEAVISCFGPRSLRESDVQEPFMRNLVQTMTTLGVKRLVNLSTWGLRDGMVPANNPVARYFILPIVLGPTRANKRRGEEHLFRSALDYVNVCPARLENEPARGGLKASLDGKGLTQYSHREDVAAFMVGQLTESTWVRKCVAVGY